MKYTIYTTGTATPIGTVTIMASKEGVCGLEFIQKELLNKLYFKVKKKYPEYELKEGSSTALKIACNWLVNYFAGKFSNLEKIPLDLIGTPFEKKVWNALLKIPPGSLSTYGQIAKAIGYPNHYRAVGRSVGENPVAIIVPCHRVIGANGELTGFASGLAKKRWLLTHEGFTVTGKERDSHVLTQDPLK